MAVTISLQDSPVSDGFLLAPVGSTYDAELSLSTDAGTLAVTLQASPNPAGLVFSQTSLTLSTVPTLVTVHATTQSATRGDTTIQVLNGGGTVVASFTVTAIKHPAVNFSGRFEVRFATDTSFYNRNPIYSSTVDNVVPPGWTWGLEGEPNFVPPIGNVPENLESPVGRVVRLNNPVALRSHALPVVSTVKSITGKTTTGDETFTTGDPIIGQEVNFGPNTYLAGNSPQNPADPAPEEFWDAALEPMALFELHFGTMFSGASRVGPFTAKATMANQRTRTPDSRPIANGLPSAAAEMAELGLPNLQSFSGTRVDALVADYGALPAGDSVDRRNLKRRIGHLLASVTSAKATAVQTAHPEISFRAGTLAPGWSNKEIYQGKVDANLVFHPASSPVVNYLSEFGSFNLLWTPFSFHSDELCGYHKGTLTHLNADGSYSGDPHTRTVNGVLYDFQAVGEFTLLRDGNRMEVQVRQWPVVTANPVTDGHTGLKSCVSIINAVAARLGDHHISLQPGRERGQIELYVDGRLTPLPKDSFEVGPHRISVFHADDGTGLRADYADGTVLLVTAHFWTANQVWYLDVSVSNTGADEGIMGFVPRDSWLPRLRNGASVGAMPGSLHDRYVTLYKKFADSWRVTDHTSLFTYAAGTSTKTFTDPDWPAEKPPCKLKPQFIIPNATPLRGMPIEKARAVCAGVKAGDLNANCVFDVATTGDPIFAKSYALAQELRERGTIISVTATPAPSRQDRLPDVPDLIVSKESQRFVLKATVASLVASAREPTGSVTFIVDGVPMRRPVPIDGHGRASTIVSLKPGKHEIKATYSGGGQSDHHASSTPSALVDLQ